MDGWRIGGELNTVEAGLSQQRARAEPSKAKARQDRTGRGYASKVESKMKKVFDEDDGDDDVKGDCEPSEFI